MGEFVILAAKGMHYLLEVVQQWKQDYHVNNQNEIVLQNLRTMANVRLNDLAIHKISGHSRGFEALPEVIADPDEIWSLWEDPKKQHVVLRSYIGYTDDSAYVVQTRDGVITDAFASTRAGANKYRRGLIL